MKYNQFPQPVIKENADYTVREITNVIKKYGPRESGNENCFATQKHLKKELDQFCDETHFEEYQLAPKGSYGYTKTVPVLAILAIIVFGALMFTNVLSVAYANIGLILALVVTIYIYAVSFGIKNGHKKVTAHNLVATRKPRGEVKKNIILLGDVDAAYEQSLVRRFKKKSYESFTRIGIYFIGLTEWIALISAVVSFKPEYNNIVKYVYFVNIITIVFLIKMLFAVDFKTVSPGANDNLTGAYAAVGALRMLDMAGVDFENTAVTTVITDGKEARSAGALAYAKAHNDEFDENTYVIAIQSLSTENPEFSSKSKSFTDTLPFLNARVNAVLLSAEDTEADYYHNRRDNAEALNQKAIEAGFGALLEEMFKFDEA